MDKIVLELLTPATPRQIGSAVNLTERSQTSSRPTLQDQVTSVIPARDQTILGQHGLFTAA
jgi:hypothetical protein